MLALSWPGIGRSRTCYCRPAARIVAALRLICRHSRASSALLTTRVAPVRLEQRLFFLRAMWSADARLGPVRRRGLQSLRRSVPRLRIARRRVQTRTDRDQATRTRVPRLRIARTREGWCWRRCWLATLRAFLGDDLMDALTRDLEMLGEAGLVPLGERVAREQIPHGDAQTL